MRRASLLAVLILLAGGARADDWLQSALEAANAAQIVDEPAVKTDDKSWVPFESAEFRSELPAVGWYAHEEEDALGTVTRVYGPDSASGAVRATISVRLYDRSMPGFLPAKDAVEAMRRDGPDRDATPVHAMRVAAGLARIFEVWQTRRVGADDGPSLPERIHEYVAIIPHGESYYVVRLVSTRENFLDTRDVFARFLKRLTPIGVR
jgi:hypothetical protein